jgi:hypothetical protein
MPKPKNVMVCMYGDTNPTVPRQSYNDNLFTRYNLGTPKLSESDFYNLCIRDGIPNAPEKPISIYGFMNTRYSYADANSISEVVSLFEMDDNIQIVTSDVLVRRNTDGVEYLMYRYVHVSDLPNVPFFVRDSAIPSLNFMQEDAALEQQMKRLHTSGHIIFHIAKPLLIAEGDI